MPSPPRTLSHLIGPPLPAVSAPTLVNLLQLAAQEDGPRPFAAFVSGRDVGPPLTFQATLDGAARVAQTLRDAGLQPHDRVALAFPMSVDFILAFFGIHLAGGVPVPLRDLPSAAAAPSDAALRGPRLVLQHSQAAFLLAPAAARPIAARLDLKRPMLSLERRARPLPPSAWAAPTPDAPALIQYTSGPVLKPRGVVLSHRAILANVAAMGQRLGMSRQTRALSWLPAYQDMSLIGVLLNALYQRFSTTYLRPELFLLSPHRFIEWMSRLRITMTAGPNFGYQACARRVRDRHLKDIDLSAWRLALSGAETVHPDTVDAFERRFAPVGLRPGALVSAYGLAENALVATFGAIEPPLHAEMPPSLPPDAPQPARLAALGTPIAGQELQIVAPNGALLPVGTIGEVCLRGPSLMTGYLDAPQATAHALQDGWLHTGDLGYVSNGELFLVGRQKRLVIKAGRNVYCQDIETLVSEALSLPTAAITACAAVSARHASEELQLRIQAPLLDSPTAQADALQTVQRLLMDVLGLQSADTSFPPANEQTADPAG